LLIYAYAALRDRQDSRAGVALALAIAFKAYPAFLLLVFLFNRRWVALRACALALAVLAVLTAIALGPHGTVDAIRFTIHLGNHVQTGGQNVSAAGTISQFTSSWLVQALLWASLVFAVLATFAMRKLPVHIAFAGACAAMLLSQSMTWREYTALIVVCAIALKDYKFDRSPFILAVVGIVLCAGTSWTPEGLETGISFLTTHFKAPSAGQTVGLLLCVFAFLSAAANQPRSTQLEPAEK
jgi:uncharacterized membrane protein